MSFEINRPIQLLSQPTFMKRDTYDTMAYAHFKQQQKRSSAYKNDTTEKSSLGPSSPRTSSSPYYHHPSTTIPVSFSLTSSQAPSNQFDSYSTNLDLSSISPLPSSPPLREKDNYLQQEQNGLLSPLPTSASLYEPQFPQSLRTDIKASTPSITDLIHPQQYMWKQDIYSPPLNTTNTLWAQSQHQEEDVFGPTIATTPTPRSLSGSPSLHYRNSMVSSNIPPCNCTPMIQYDSMYNHPETLSVPYHDPSALTLASSASSPPPGIGMYSDLVNRDNNMIMGYSDRSQQQLFTGPSYQYPSLDLSPSTSSSLSDDYSQHHHQQQQHYSINNNIDNHIGSNPIMSSSSSSSSTTKTTTSTASTPRRYKCTVCVKRFTRPSSLATHMHSHTGEKPYKCLVDGCGRRFSVVSNLRRHAKIHLHTTSMVGSGRKLHLV